jgi:hypothetical protein
MDVCYSWGIIFVGICCGYLIHKLIFNGAKRLDCSSKVTGTFTFEEIILQKYFLKRLHMFHYL